VYFNHSAHVNSGVSCVECHGQINQMDVVEMVKPMNMAWCLQCHRDPTDRIRPRDQVTRMDWKPSPDDASTVAAFASLSDSDLSARASKVGLAVTGDKKQLAHDYVARIVQNESNDKVRRELGEILKA